MNTSRTFWTMDIKHGGKENIIDIILKRDFQARSRKLNTKIERSKLIYILTISHDKNVARTLVKDKPNGPIEIH